MQRRAFIQGLAATCAIPWLAGCKDPKKQPPSSTTQAEPAPHTWRFFIDPNERAVAAASLERLLPAEASVGAPSAQELHVLEFLDEQLTEPHFRELQRMMHGGFNFLDQLANKRFGGPFVSRSPEVQDQILAQFQTGSVKGMKFPQERFFETLRSFALEGYWGHPKYLGNYDKKAWTWVNINPHCKHIHGACTE